MKKLFLLLMIVPMISFGQCISGDCENGYGVFMDTGYSGGETKYVGEFKDGVAHGEGVFYLANGNIFIGTQKYGDYYNGTYIFSSGDIYIGEFKENSFGGRGMYFYNSTGEYGTQMPVNTKYEGEFSDGLTPHGYGKVTYADGKVKEGLWENGKFVK